MLGKEKKQRHPFRKFWLKIRNPEALAFLGAIAFILLSTALVLIALTKMFSYGGNFSVKAISEIVFDSEYHRTVVRTLSYSLFAVLLKILIAVPLAIILKSIRQNGFRNFVLIPWVLPPAVSALAWMWLFYDIDGGANLLLKFFGIPGVSWLGESKSAFLVCLFFNVWREVPLWTWLITPTLAGIKGSVATLAKQDELSKFERLRLLVIPRMKPVLIALTLLSLIWTFGEFEAIWVLTRGGPGESTELLSVFAYRHTFMAQNIGKGASAFLCFLPISITIFTLLIILYKRSELKTRQ